MESSKRFILGCPKSSVRFFIVNFKHSQVSQNKSLLVEIRTVRINTFLPTSYKLIYSGRVKIWASGYDKLFEVVFHVVMIFELLITKEVIKMLEKVVVCGRKVW